MPKNKTSKEAKISSDSSVLYFNSPTAQNYLDSLDPEELDTEDWFKEDWFNEESLDEEEADGLAEGLGFEGMMFLYIHSLEQSHLSPQLANFMLFFLFSNDQKAEKELHQLYLHYRSYFSLQEKNLMIQRCISPEKASLMRELLSIHLYLNQENPEEKIIEDYLDIVDNTFDRYEMLLSHVLTRESCSKSETERFRRLHPIARYALIENFRISLLESAREENLDAEDVEYLLDDMNEVLAQESTALNYCFPMTESLLFNDSVPGLDLKKSIDEILSCCGQKVDRARNGEEFLNALIELDEDCEAYSHTAHFLNLCMIGGGMIPEDLLYRLNLDQDRIRQIVEISLLSPGIGKDPGWLIESCVTATYIQAMGNEIQRLKNLYREEAHKKAKGTIVVDSSQVAKLKDKIRRLETVNQKNQEEIKKLREELHQLKDLESQKEEVQRLKKELEAKQSKLNQSER